MKDSEGNIMRISKDLTKEQNYLTDISIKVQKKRQKAYGKTTFIPIPSLFTKESMC